MYEYRCSIAKVIDGDTVDVVIDLGFCVSIQMRIRMNGINAPEMSTPEGKAAKAFLEGMLPVGSQLLLKTDKDHKEKYGRYLGTLQYEQAAGSINDAMLEAGMATKYNGGK
jgi:micrococcal nuclease